jgi:prevent-host-death family protein
VTAVNIHEAKTHLSRLLARVQQGEEIVIAKAGKPVAKLVKIDAKPTRVLGAGVGTIKFTPGWDAPMTDEEVDEFFGL